MNLNYSSVIFMRTWDNYSIESLWVNWNVDNDCAFTSVNVIHRHRYFNCTANTRTLSSRRANRHRTNLKTALLFPLRIRTCRSDAKQITLIYALLLEPRMVCEERDAGSISSIITLFKSFLFSLKITSSSSLYSSCFQRIFSFSLSLSLFFHAVHLQSSRYLLTRIKELQPPPGVQTVSIIAIIITVRKSIRYRIPPIMCCEQDAASYAC